jgi:hypothetical protein
MACQCFVLTIVFLFGLFQVNVTASSTVASAVVDGRRSPRYNLATPDL